MAKDALGHGSNSRGAGGYKPIADHPYHAKTNDELRYIQKDAHEAGRNAQGMGDQRGINKYADQVNDASTVLAYRARGGASDAPSDLLASGPKSAAVDVHDAMKNSYTARDLDGPDTTKPGSYMSRDSRLNAWGQSPKDAKIARKQIRDAKRQNRMR